MFWQFFRMPGHRPCNDQNFSSASIQPNHYMLINTTKSAKFHLEHRVPKGRPSKLLTVSSPELGILLLLAMMAHVTPKYFSWRQGTLSLNSNGGNLAKLYFCSRIPCSRVKRFVFSLTFNRPNWKVRRLAVVR